MKRTHVTVARLKNVKLHAVRIHNHLHVTGLTIHGVLMVPTRTFWSRLAQLAHQPEPEFGSEYSLFHDCLRNIGRQSLNFTVTVHDDKATLLTEVALLDQIGHREVTARRHSLTHTAMRGRKWPVLDKCRLDGVGSTADASSWADDLEAQNDSTSATETDMTDCPLLNATPAESSHDRLWGWEHFRHRPAGLKKALLGGPEGTLRPSRN